MRSVRRMSPIPAIRPATRRAVHRNRCLFGVPRLSEWSTATSLASLHGERSASPAVSEMDVYPRDGTPRRRVTHQRQRAPRNPPRRPPCPAPFPRPPASTPRAARTLNALVLEGPPSSSRSGPTPAPALSRPRNHPLRPRSRRGHRGPVQPSREGEDAEVRAGQADWMGDNRAELCGSALGDEDREGGRHRPSGGDASWGMGDRDEVPEGSAEEVPEGA